MFSFKKNKLKLPTPEKALPGRSSEMPVPERHAVNGNALRGPFPDGTELAMFGMGCFWGAERKFWQLDGVFSTAVGYAGGLTPNPTYREVCSGMTGHNEVVLVVFDPSAVAYRDLLRTFWESHDPTQGMRQGNDVGTQYRSGIYVFDDRQRELAEESAAAYQAVLEHSGYGENHHRGARCSGFLLRRGLPPAVPGQEPGWLLRARGNGSELSVRNRCRQLVPSTPKSRRLHRHRAGSVAVALRCRSG